MKSSMNMPQTVPVRQMEVDTRSQVSLLAYLRLCPDYVIIETTASLDNRRRRPICAKKDLEGAHTVSIYAQSHLKIDKLVKLGEIRNKIAQEVASANKMMAKSSKFRSSLDHFSIQGTNFLLKMQFERKLQRLVLLEMDEELRGKGRGTQNAAKGFQMVETGSASHRRGGRGCK